MNVQVGEITLNEPQRQKLFDFVCRLLYRSAIDQDCSTSAVPAPSEPVAQVAGAFVTLKKDGELRSCFGCFGGAYDVAEALRAAAVGAATKDPRFPRLNATELVSLTVELSMLHHIQLLDCKPRKRDEHFEVGRHGLIVSAGEQSGLLLPVVAVEHRLTPESFLRATCKKAGLAAEAWATDTTSVRTFEAVRFGGTYPATTIGE